MIPFLLLWLLAITIVFSIEIIAGLYWYDYIYQSVPLSQKVARNFISHNYSDYLKISDWWFLFIICFLSGSCVGWFTEKYLKVLSKMNRYWQQKQPEFYRDTKGENRVFLPWLIIELPVLIMSVLILFLIITFKSYTTFLLALLFFTGGFTIGQLVEGYVEYKNIINLDRPEKAPESIIQKFNPNFSSEKSLLMGQIYTKVVVPFFFLYISIFIPLKILLFKNSDDRNLLIMMVAILLGIAIRWHIDREKAFYFGKVTIENVLFTVLKMLLMITLIVFSLHYSNNSYIPAIICVFAGFIIPWQPEVLRK